MIHNCLGMNVCVPQTGLVLKQHLKTASVIDTRRFSQWMDLRPMSHSCFLAPKSVPDTMRREATEKVAARLNYR